MKKVVGIMSIVAVLAVVFGMWWIAPREVGAHCDTMSGPVIQAAQKALESGNITPVLMWVKEKDEPEIKKAFEKTLAVRKLNPQAKELADMGAIPS